MGKDCAEKNNLAFVGTSAKEIINIEKAFRRLVDEMIENTGLLEKLGQLPKEERPRLFNQDTDEDEEDKEDSDDNIKNAKKQKPSSKKSNKK